MPLRNAVVGVLISLLAATAAMAQPPTVKPGATFRDCSDCPEMVWLPAGRFMMGTDAKEAEGLEYERPRHAVTVSSPFAIGKYHVTRGEYARFVQATKRDGGFPFGCETDRGREFQKSWRDPGFPQTDRDPVVCVNWDDAKAYAEWLSEVSGKTYRLPTEAQWEYAARAGTTSARWWGDAIGVGNANCHSCGSQWDDKRTSPVGSFRPNSLGLHDILGNALQWTEDCWKDNYANAPVDAAIEVGAEYRRRVSARPSAAELFGCGRRVQRGGAWRMVTAGVRSGYRRSEQPVVKSDMVGFRVVRNQ